MFNTLKTVQNRDMVHRDIKGENIMMHLSNDGQYVFPKVIDFGLAVKCGDNSRAKFAGTPHTMAPAVFADLHYPKQARFRLCPNGPGPLEMDGYSLVRVSLSLQLPPSGAAKSTKNATIKKTGRRFLRKNARPLQPFQKLS